MSTVALVAGLTGGAASAQALRNARAPSEIPPASFTANQYVDSRGCVFVRAGISGQVQWVPRVSRSREQLCGFQPTQLAGARPSAPRPADPAPTPAPAPAPVATAAAAPVRTPPQAGAAPRRVAQTTAAISASPRVVTAPPTPTAPAAAARQVTRAEACAGRTGVQAGFISSRTGRPIDCGGTPPAPERPQIARVIAPAPAEISRPRGITRAQACADMQTTGRPYISATTGLPITCAPQSQQSAPSMASVQIASARPVPSMNPAPSINPAMQQNRRGMSAAQQQYSNLLDRAPGSTFAPAPATAFGRAPLVAPRVAPVGAAVGFPVAPTANRRPVPYSNPLNRAPGSMAQSGSGGFGQLFNQNPPPYSNPRSAQAEPAPPAGYAQVWEDGRLNPNRGLPQQQTVRYAAQPRAQIVTQPRVSSRAAPQTPQAPSTPPREQISGQRYVQVGTFGTRVQAQAAAQALRSRGLPMRIGVYQQDGRELRMVLAGPFANDSQLQNALGTARSAGYSGAFSHR